MPELVGSAAQGKPVIWRHHLSVKADGTEGHKMRTGTLRADLGHFRRPKAARKGELNFVGHLLIAQDQNGMFLECRTRRRICRIVRGNIRKRHTAQFGGESWTQRHDVHRQVLPLLLLLATLGQNCPAGNDARRLRSSPAAPSNGRLCSSPAPVRRSMTRPMYMGLPTG